MTGAAERIVLALDVPDEAQALAWAARFQGRVGLYKIGLRLFTAGGPSLVAKVAERGPVFLDLKYHDIPNTVASAVHEAVKLGAAMLTVHASGGLAMLRAAAEAASEAAAVSAPHHAPAASRPGDGRPRTRILAVTLLTSLDARDLADLGIARTLSTQVRSLAETAWFAGCDGIVASPLEACVLRASLGPGAMLVTPGIRSLGSPPDDQRRTASPAEALAAGADYLVIGRPILGAADPDAALDEIVRSMEERP